ncbi:hypothetical protein M9434_006088 [Picochlorum sp. BPE23]|nr:hypothetical protein M9434_006088 [Picochlorum sp. BPE23]
MPESSINVRLCFKLTDELESKTNSWNSFLTQILPTDALSDVICLQDEIVTIKNTKIGPYLDAPGTRITEILLNDSHGQVVQLGAHNAALIDMKTLLELNGSNLLRLDVSFKVTSFLEENDQGQESARIQATRAVVKEENEIQPDVGQVLRTKSHRNGLPELSPNTLGRNKLWNTLLDFCEQNLVTCPESVSQSYIEKVFEDIVDILWALNHLDCGTESWKLQPPRELDLFLGFDCQGDRGRRKKRKRDAMTKENLSAIFEKLYRVLGAAPFRTHGPALHRFLADLYRSVHVQLVDGIEVSSTN